MLNMLVIALWPVLCTAGGEPPMDPVEAKNNLKLDQLYAGSQCGDGNEAQAQWISTQAQLEALYKNLRKGKIGGAENATPGVDFDNNGVLYISMGQRRTGGYGVKLLEDSLTLGDNAAIVKIHWLEPAPGAIQIQVITSPCLLVKVPLGKFSRIEVFDQAQVSRYSLVL